MRKASTLITRLAACLLPALALAQQPAAPGSDIPRMLDGKPDFQGNWFKRSMYGPTGINPRVAPQAGDPASGAGGGPGAGPGGGRGNDAFAAARTLRGGDLKRIIDGVEVPYLPEALAEARWRKINQYLDGEPRCHLAGVPRAAEQPPYPHLIIQDEHTLTILYEYVHEPRIIPLDGSPHPKNYRSWDGDSRGHWEGDTLVVDVANFNGRSWLDMEGNFVDENLHVIERYRLLDANTYEYSATLEDPTVFAKPWTFTLKVLRQPNADQILEYGCLEGEGDLNNYADVIEARKAAYTDAHAIRGCLRGEPGKPDGDYELLIGQGRKVKLVPQTSLQARLPELIDREVRFGGQWQGTDQKAFTAETARAISEGCTASKW